jgi:hypothetical protein
VRYAFHSLRLEDLLPLDLPAVHSCRAWGAPLVRRSRPAPLPDFCSTACRQAATGAESGAFRLTRPGRREPVAGGPWSLREAASGQ